MTKPATPEPPAPAKKARAVLTADAELKAMETLAKVFAPLTPAERCRVIIWAGQKYELYRTPPVNPFFGLKTGSPGDPAPTACVTQAVAPPDTDRQDGDSR